MQVVRRHEVQMAVAGRILGDGEVDANGMA